MGNPGWILLSHSEEGRPLALFVDKNEKPVSLPIILDERLFSDTVIRVIQLKPSVFLACDLRYLNGKCVYDTLSFSARKELLDSLLESFHKTDLTALLTHDEVPVDSLLHGCEYYDNEPGTLGVFIPTRE